MLRFHFQQNRPLNRLVAFRNPGFDTSREVSKQPISTLPALTAVGTRPKRKTAENGYFRLFSVFPGIQAALAYTFDRTGQSCQDPGQQGWPGWPGSGSRAARDGPGSRVPGALEGSWDGPVVPARPLPASPAWLGWTWSLSNTYPGSPWPGLEDRARSTEDTGTTTAGGTSRCLLPGPAGGP